MSSMSMRDLGQKGASKPIVLSNGTEVFEAQAQHTFAAHSDLFLRKKGMRRQKKHEANSFLIIRENMNTTQEARVQFAGATLQPADDDISGVLENSYKKTKQSYFRASSFSPRGWRKGPRCTLFFSSHKNKTKRRPFHPNYETGNLCGDPL